MDSPDRLLCLPDHKDAEPFESLTVTRCRVVGANYLGRTFTEEGEIQLFQRASDAINWSLESPAHMHAFEVPLPDLKFSARLDGERRSDSEWIVAWTPERTGFSPRNVENHHSVSTDYANFFHLIIKLEFNQHVLFDRGVIWLRPNEGEAPSLLFDVMPGEHTLDELRSGIAQMLGRVNKVGADLVRGMV